MSIDKYDPIRVLGEGSFGKVYLMRDKVRRNFVCVKVIKIKNIPKKEREATKVEVDLLRRLHHPNIVQYIDSFLSKNNEVLCICMEYCDGGDLASQIKAARKNLFSESKILHWFVQLCLGLHYMHSNKVLHRDLKTQNVFLLGNGRLVLGDLGISKVLDGTMDFAQTCIGTPYYMSPEIFQNKPYSYKSDVWALGCVLYEMTTLNHAFDANSLNGLACKIVKGRYPPIHSKYSKYLRDLIGQMLLINPQQRPDLDQILRKPFIKKHIVNFFTDIASRPSTSIGEGTMIMKVAAGGGGVGAINKDSNVIALQKQLQELDMAGAVSEALAPKAAPVDPVEAKKMVKEQASALRREEEHKKMVEAALDKLRQERENRSKEKEKTPGGPPVPKSRPLASNASVASIASGAGGQGRREEPAKAAAFRQPAIQQQPQAAQLNRGPSQAGLVRDGGIGWGGAKKPAEQKDPDVLDSARDSRPRGRRATFDKEKQAAEERKQQDDLLARERERERQLEDRRREDVKQEARNREEARAREEARQRQEAASKQRLEELRAQQELANKRDQQRDKERARQKEEIEQLKRDKLELDRLAAERDRVREERRTEERRKLEEARSRDRLHGDDYPQEKGSASRSSFSDYDRDRDHEVVPRYQARSDDKEGLSARDRVLMRKQEKQAKDEQDRLDALRDAEVDARALRAAAAQQKRALYEGSSVLPSAAPSTRASFAGHDAKDGSDDRPAYAGGAGRRPEPMDVDELALRLQDATRGLPRYEPTRSPEGSVPNTARSGYPVGGTRTPVPGGLARYSDESGSEDEDEAEIFIQRSAAGASTERRANEELEEDLHKREEELRAELNVSTIRCQELKRTLQATKSFMGATPGPLSVGRPQAAAPGSILGGIGRARPQPLTIESGDGESDYEDDAFEESTELEESWAEDDRFDDATAGAGMRGGEGKDNGGEDVATPRRDRPAPIVARASPYQNLQDPPTPSGRLSDRIDRLRQKCVEALGQEAFEDAYQFLKDFEESHTSSAHGFYDDSAEEVKKSRMRGILGDAKAHYTSLIEQLLFMEETHCR